MSSNEYNLTDNVNDDFPFKINGNHYKMRFPLMEEIEELQLLTARQQDADDEESKLRAAEATREYMYSFISATEEDTPSISEALKKSNIKVMNNFNMMVQKEFGIK